MLNDAELVRHRRHNLRQSVVLLGGMAALLAAVGELLAGRAGALTALVMALAIGLLGSRISPALVLRLFQARPIPYEQAPDLYRLLAELARRAGLPRVPLLHHMPSPVMNAFSVGGPKAAAIGLTDGLLRGLSPRELTGVLAHEVSHLRHNDVWVMGLSDVVSRLTRAFSLVGQLALLINLPLVLMGKVHVPFLPLLLLIFAPALSALLQLGLSRTREHEADLGAADLTGDPEGLAQALVRMERVQSGWLGHVLFPGRRSPEPSLLRTHPLTEERVRRLKSLAARRPPVEQPLPRELLERALARWLEGA